MRGRTRVLTAAVTALALVVVAAAAVYTRRDTEPLDEAIALVEDDGGFTTALAAARRFARASELAATDAEQCQRRQQARAEHCAQRFAAAAYLRSLAVGVLECARPGIYDARTAALSHLRALRDGENVAGPPRLPRC